MTNNAPILPWSDKYSVGLPDVDTQHKELIRLINSLHAAMSEGKGKEVLGSILDDLVRYTRTHFAYEESLLRERGYTDLAAHTRIHQELTHQVLDLQAKLKSGKLTITIEVMTFLKHWLADHILSRDLAYAKAFGTLPVPATSAR
jgi:hemerythrin